MNEARKVLIDWKKIGAIKGLGICMRLRAGAGGAKRGGS